MGGVVRLEGAVEEWTLTTYLLLTADYCLLPTCYLLLTTHHEAEEWSLESRWVPTDCCSV